MTLYFPVRQTFHRFRGTRRTGRQDASRVRPPSKLPWDVLFSLGSGWALLFLDPRLEHQLTGATDVLLGLRSSHVPVRPADGGGVHAVLLDWSTLFSAHPQAIREVDSVLQ